MRGNGTNPAITTADMAPSARLLDLTRSLRRTGRMATGVDRVELAYLEHFITDDAPVFGILRTALGYVLLDREGMRAFHGKLMGQMPWGPPSALSRLVRGRSVIVQSAESDARRSGIGRCMRGRLTQLLQRYLPTGFAYYNVGHSNLTDRMLGGVKAVGGSIHTLIHDVIPLEYPEYQRPGSVAPFRAKLARVSAYADRVIYNSHDTQKRTEQYLLQMGRVPNAIVAHLGTIFLVPDLSALPVGLLPEGPYFVTVGTIEPRKNHAFLLDLWAEMGPSAPPLLICGGRGWNNHSVFSRLDALGPSDNIHECSGLPDAALAALVQNSAGALIPSFAEGYGLPVVEALSLGARVLCNNLPIFHEIVGEKVIYAPVSERSLWISTTREWEISQPVAQDQAEFEGPQWRDHFKTVLSLT